MTNTIKELPEGYCQARGAGGRGRGVGGGWVGVGWPPWAGAPGGGAGRGVSGTQGMCYKRPSPPAVSQITCGRCQCTTVDTALRAAGLAALADAAPADWAAQWRKPSFEGALLVPTAGAGVLTPLHVLPPVPEWGNATWKAALLRGAGQVQSAGGVLTATVAPDGGVLLAGPAGKAARLVKGDVQACKAVLHFVDGALA